MRTGLPVFLANRTAAGSSLEFSLPPKPPPRVKHDHAHIGDGNFENSGELALDNVGILVAGPHGYPTAG